MSQVEITKGDYKRPKSRGSEPREDIDAGEVRSLSTSNLYTESDHEKAGQLYLVHQKKI